MKEEKWVEALRQSKIFLVLATENYFTKHMIKFDFGG